MNAADKDGLTEVDRQIVGLLREGLTMGQIGSVLKKSTQTVKNHVLRIGRRLMIPPGHGLAQRVLQKLDGDVLDPTRIARLNPVQRDIVAHAIRGASHRAIAQKLGLGSAGTVKNRMNAIYDLTGASNVRELRNLLVVPTLSMEANPR